MLGIPTSLANHKVPCVGGKHTGEREHWLWEGGRKTLLRGTRGLSQKGYGWIVWDTVAPSFCPPPEAPNQPGLAFRSVGQPKPLA